MQISVEDKDPKRATELVNGYSDELFRQNKPARHRGGWPAARVFFSSSLPKRRTVWRTPRIAMKLTQQSTGVLQLSGQAQNIIGQEANIQANITSREVQLGALLSSSTEQNPDVVRLRTELTELRAQLQQMQKGTSSTDVDAEGVPMARGCSTSAKNAMCSITRRCTICWRGNWRRPGSTRPRPLPAVQVRRIHRRCRGRSHGRSHSCSFLLGLILGTMFGCIRCAVIYVYEYPSKPVRICASAINR